MDEEEDQNGMRYLKTTMKYLFSHVGLFVLVCAYCVGGAFLFMHIEGTDEELNLQEGMNRSQAIEIEREILARDLWMHKWSVTFNQTVDELLQQYHENVTDAIEKYSYKGYRINSSSEIEYGWSFPSALLFTVTIVTTIGYGHVSPASELGQIAVILYSLLGIPLMLMFLANIGDAMAKFFRNAYGKGCCYFCYQQRKKNYEVNRKRQQQIRQNDEERPKSAWDDDLDSIDGDGPRKRSGSIDECGDPNRDDTYGDLKDQKSANDYDSDLDMDIYDLDENVINVPISLTLVIIAAYIFIGAVLFATWNNWTWITGAYFSFVTLSTIGFGDLVPGWDEVGSTVGKIKLAVSSFYIVLGLAVLSMSFNLMMEEMIAKFKWLGRKLGIIQDPDPPRSLDDKAPLVSDEQLPDVDDQLAQQAEATADNIS